MSIGDRLAITCVIFYVVIALAYLLSKDWKRAVYYLSASILNFTVLLMRN